MCICMWYVYCLSYDNVVFPYSSPSVLDRLNPLFEPNPVLTIDEVGVVDGRVLTVVPHPEFR